jgi:hypothetical protein
MLNIKINVRIHASVLATAGTPIAQYGRQQLMSFRGNSRKSREETHKKSENYPF